MYIYLADIAVSPPERFLAAGCDEIGVQVWDVASGKKLYFLEVQKDLLRAIAFSVDERSLLIGLADGKPLKWDICDEQDRRDLSRRRLYRRPGSLSILTATRCSSPELTIACDFVALVRNESQSLHGNPPAVTGAAFSRDGKRIAVKCGDADNGGRLEYCERPFDLQACRQAQLVQLQLTKTERSYSPAPAPMDLVQRQLYRATR